MIKKTKNKYFHIQQWTLFCEEMNQWWHWKLWQKKSKFIFKNDIFFFSYGQLLFWQKENWNLWNCDYEQQKKNVFSKKNFHVIETCVDVIIYIIVINVIIINVIVIIVNVIFIVFIWIKDGVDERCFFIILIFVIQCVFVFENIAFSLWIVNNNDSIHEFVSIICVFGLDSNIKHENRSAFKIKSHQYCEDLVERICTPN